MPNVRKPSVAAGGKKAKPSVSENQEEGSRVKRATSPSRGAAKKRTAFIDLTNSTKVQISFPGKKKDLAKKQVKKTSASCVSGKKTVKQNGTSSETSGEKPVKKEDGTETAEAAAADKLEAAVYEVPTHLRRPEVPGEFDIDSEYSEDCSMCPDYAMEIFDYLKQREEKFVLSDYMTTQPSLNVEMRAVLIDWLVEVQENFELFHETLYLAVKLTDHYLARAPIHRNMLQLVGTTAVLLASKFEEYSVPSVEEFLYVCDDAYSKEELLAMEANILRTLSFDINIPIPYRFLRRYAKCVNAGMDTLTLARYFCERSLLEMELVVVRGSLLASSCLLLAMLTKDLGGWSPILQFHTGYVLSDVAPVVRMVYAMMVQLPNDKLNAIRTKYSHKVFFQVASLPMVDMEVLEKALSH
ncbi:G2/mitotic-specific cyclin-B3 [Dunckerocampus dactyliophorus]|uniref:G2/mitotic-specific cyclin-B3 n=1 Tax=Dunckerocampus dactyliophorus TaxID=161453 RepID=UPI00240671EA|nr:G2/mitotic-specific cyclin-B3 [Dunckerocampus dactyliophorus]